jgi:1-deoxy-D-xylulose-5-phosphate synthase
MRLFPNLVVMAPGDEDDLGKMLEFALAHEAPVSIRYPKAGVENVAERRTPVELGRSEVLHWGSDGMLIACGTLLGNCLKAAAVLRDEGLDFGVINARFIKPLDTATILKAIETVPVVITVEEGTLAGGYGSAVLEAANDAGLSCNHVRRLGIPDRFIEHADRGELLADLGLDPAGIAAACRAAADETGVYKTAGHRRVS